MWRVDAKGPGDGAALELRVSQKSKERNTIPEKRKRGWS